MKIGRNDPCHCGSEKKYKKCCEAEDQQKLLAEQKAQEEAAQSAANAAEQAAQAGSTEGATAVPEAPATKRPSPGRGSSGASPSKSHLRKNVLPRRI